jgi:hypothetical protein
MARQTLNRGTVANDGTGDTLRTAAQKINENFAQLYTAIGGDEATATVRLTAAGVEFEGQAADIDPQDHSCSHNDNSKDSRCQCESYL